MTFGRGASLRAESVFEASPELRPKTAKAGTFRNRPFAVFKRMPAGTSGLHSTTNVSSEAPIN